MIFKRRLLAVFVSFFSSSSVLAHEASSNQCMDGMSSPRYTSLSKWALDHERIQAYSAKHQHSPIDALMKLARSSQSYELPVSRKFLERLYGSYKESGHEYAFIVYDYEVVTWLITNVYKIQSSGELKLVRKLEKLGKIEDLLSQQGAKTIELFRLVLNFENRNTGRRPWTRRQVESLLLFNKQGVSGLDVNPHTDANPSRFTLFLERAYENHLEHNFPVYFKLVSNHSKERLDLTREFAHRFSEISTVFEVLRFLDFNYETTIRALDTFDSLMEKSLTEHAPDSPWFKKRGPWTKDFQMRFVLLDLALKRGLFADRLFRSRIRKDLSAIESPIQQMLSSI